MNIFLAGAENKPHFDIARLTNHKNFLVSYYHISKNEKDLNYIFNNANKAGMKMICDSGLFTMMFGAGKDRTYDFKFMRDYTREYIRNVKQWGIKDMTIVECDVHKILGMKEVFELRKEFEDSGLNVMYVWHIEETLKGYYDLLKKYEYIAISVPELRAVFKENEHSYQAAVKDLLRKAEGEKKIPKIHLLGNTVMDTMKTRVAYSCDSTSWLSGGRYGMCYAFIDNKLRTCTIHSPEFEIYKKTLFEKYGDQIIEFEKIYGEKEYNRINIISALAFKQCQDYLDKNYQWINQGSIYENHISRNSEAST